MNDDEKIISRADINFGEENFTLISNLYLEFPWIDSYQNEINYLLYEAEHNEVVLFVIELIKRFTYIDDKKFRESLLKIANIIQNEWKLKSNNTLIVATCNSKEPDGSQVVIQGLKNKLEIDWAESLFVSNLNYLAEIDLSNIESIVLVDDFIGTGNTIKERLDSIVDIVGCKNIYLVTIALMKESSKILNGLPITYYSNYKLNKGISDFGEWEKESKYMEFLESKLSPKWDKLKCPNFGYGKSESLISIMDNNIPNNVFPIFWWPLSKSGKRNQMFKRVSQRR